MNRLIVDPQEQFSCVTVRADPGSVVIAETDFEFIDDVTDGIRISTTQALMLASALLEAIETSTDLSEMFSQYKNSGNGGAHDLA